MTLERSVCAVVLALVLAAAAVAGAGAEPPASSLLVNTTEGVVRGRQEKETQSFLGIPFAAPPVGERRWQPPQPPARFSSVYDATFFRADCASPKSSDYIKFDKLSEDCLYLNVYRPNPGATDALLPVMVFLYGGSWEYGGSSFPIYEGYGFAGNQHVLLVTVNYRLDAFGFLGSRFLARETPDNSTGNFGLQDQRAALQWVQRNIANFGGDPARVMLFGESAGAGSVSNHGVLPRSEGLFVAAGMESGPPCDWTARSLARAETQFQIVSQSLGCSGSGEQQVACLRSKNTTEILQARATNVSHQLLDWAPCIDGVEMSDEPQHRWQEGKTIKSLKTLLLGTNTNEGTLFIDLHPDATAADYENWVMTRFGPSLGPVVLKQYPASNFSLPYWAASRVFTDSLMACPARRAAQWTSSHGLTTYLYQFTHLAELIKLFAKNDGVCHASEVPFVFDFWPLLIGEGEPKLGRSMQRYWAQIASGEKPTGESGDPAWPPFDSQGSYLELDIPITPKTHFKDDPCKLWDDIYAKGCQVLFCPCPCSLDDE